MRAAGGIVTRRGVADGLQVVVVHRPSRADWTFPKGKLEPGESFEACARREVREETGLTCRLGTYVGQSEYDDHRGRPKVVRYWLMTPEEGRSVPFEANAEVDEVRWVGVAEASGLLTYHHDREILATAAAREAV